MFDSFINYEDSAAIEYLKSKQILTSVYTKLTPNSKFIFIHFRDQNSNKERKNPKTSSLRDENKMYFTL